MHTVQAMNKKGENMLSMQTFYSSLFSPKVNQASSFQALLQVARASLKEILAVRSTLAWDTWDAS